MNKFYVCAAAMILLTGCKSVGYDDLTPAHQPNTTLLPMLEIKTDTSIYPRSLDIGEEKKVQDRRGKDAENIFRKEVRQNIIEPTGKKHGYITMRISYENTDNVDAYVTAGVLSAFTLGIPTLLGVPFGAKNQDLEIEVQILNKNKDVIRSYTERAEDTEYKALWWGYGSYSVYRKVAAENLKRALTEIRHQINSEAPQIRAELK